MDSSAEKIADSDIEKSKTSLYPDIVNEIAVDGGQKPWYHQARHFSIDTIGSLSSIILNRYQIQKL
jgi:hypothetical protein